MLEQHPRIIVGRAIVADDWQVLRPDEGQSAAELTIPAGKVLLPLALWLALGQADAAADAGTPDAGFAARLAAGELGVWIGADERPELLAGQLAQLAVIGVDFPKFTDGRGYSIAFNLRQRLGYTGQLRALGDVLRDQLFSLHRVGFDAFAVRADRSIDEAVKGLTDFSETYQASVNQPLPLFRRAARTVQAKPAASADVGYGI